jgi:hypothetical protein
MAQVKGIVARKTNRRLIIIVGVAVIVVLLGAYRWLGPLTPGAIKERAVHALETGDAEALCRLADKEELTKLNLTPQNVEAFLHETVWKDGMPKADGERRSDEPDDRAVWVMHWRGQSSDPHAQVIAVIVIDTPGVGWKLLLGELLRLTCMYRYGAPEGWTKYWELARKYGIRGTRDPGGPQGEYLLDSGQK